MKLLSNFKTLYLCTILGLILAACGGSPQPSITSVSVTPATSSVQIGATVTLSSQVVALNGALTTVIWSSSDPSKATVNAGVVTGVAVGTVTITATSTADTSKKGTATITVTASTPAPTITAVSLSPDTANLTVGGSTTLTATVTGTGSFNNAVTWSSSDDSKATVSNSGQVSALAAGSVTITATSVADTSKKGSATITISAVTPPPPTITAVSVSPDTANLTVGGSTTLSATVTGTGSFDNAVTWSTSDSAKATVSNTGGVSALAVGTVTITATSVADSSKSGSATITISAVTPPPPTISGVSLNPDTATLAVNATQQFSATVSGTGAFDQSVTWASSDITVATVNASGLVTAKAPGTTTITATSVADTSKSDTATVTVTAVLSFSNYASLVATVDTEIPDQKPTVTGGSAPYTYSAITPLPAGLELDTDTGFISGTPTASAVASNYTIQVSDALNATATAAINIIINAAPSLTYTPTKTLTQGTAITAADYTRTLSGGTAPFTYSVAPGDLPDGITLNTNTGDLSGAPTVDGSFDITITVTDANGATADSSFTLVVNEAVSIEYDDTAYSASSTATNNTLVAAAPAVTGTSSFTFEVLTQSYAGSGTGNPTFTNQFNINTATGAITTKNTPKVGTYTITIRVTDANGAQATTPAITITVN